MLQESTTKANMKTQLCSLVPGVKRLLQTKLFVILEELYSKKYINMKLTIFLN